MTTRRRSFLLVSLGVLEFWMRADPGRAQPVPSPGAAAVGWIRLEGIPERAESLHGRSNTARTYAAAQAVPQQIEARLAEVGPALGVPLERAGAANAKRTSLPALEDVRRELEAASAPLAGWKGALAAEGKRLVALLQAGVSVGELSITLAGVVAFMVTLVVTMVLSRIIDGVAVTSLTSELALAIHRGFPRAGIAIPLAGALASSRS